MPSWLGVGILLICSWVLGNEAMKTEMVSYCFIFVYRENYTLYNEVTINLYF